MQDNIKPLNYEKIIITRVNEIYQNIKQNIRDSFKVPKTVTAFFEEVSTLNSLEELEKFGECVNASIKEWKPISDNQDEIIIVNHILSIIKNSIVVLMSINTNLKKEELETKIIKTKKGIDILITTAVQALGIKFSELCFKYNELKLENDKQEIFKNFNLWLTKVVEQDSMLAFSMLIENMLSFIENYKQLNNKIINVVDDDMSQSRVQIFMDYIETYYLLVFLLELVLTYPLQEGLMNQTTFNNMLPNINLYK
ncbi:hypothetical protein SLITO_v1c10550 [Spiroplasma litorale]|uniref:Uncharacterized protein n=1 Tax=Spiroplasma litorale TaxID=216942 RepID=A0A0K1W3A0_9MOLU|nr:hypothetical protein [Spiroplasma litorale]AKX34666.1 hypothetical protein SLITO_v1c10550 [Spiroplasma litorale]